MSHHFDTLLAKQDPRLNVSDMYVFEGENDSTAFVITTNADTGISAPDTLHEEAIYSFHIHRGADLGGHEAFKFRFSEPVHIAGLEHIHSQPYRLIHADHNQLNEDAGEVVLTGETGTIAEKNGVRAFVGVVPELWAANAVAFGAFMKSIWELNRFDLSVWTPSVDFFEHRNVMAIVLEVPNAMLGSGEIKVWSRITLFGHAPEVQVARWGLPLISHLFLTNPVDDKVEEYHKHSPEEDGRLFGPTIRRFVSKLVALADTADDPDAYANAIVSKICPSILPYIVGSKASFKLERFNGRPLADDALDVMFTLAANTPIADGVSPDRTRIQKSFPYYGRPYDETEQLGLAPIPQHARTAY